MIEAVQTSEGLSQPAEATTVDSADSAGREVSTTRTPCRFGGFRDPSSDSVRTRREDRTLAILDQVEKLVSSVVQLITAIMQFKQKEPQKTDPCATKPSTETTPTDVPNPTKPIAKIPSGSTLAKSGEFLWKPASEKDKKLVILLPSSMSSSVKSVQIISPKATKILETGSYSGIGNGDRAHFRFKKSGGSYPDGSIVLISLNDGTRRHVTIKNTEARFTT